MNENDLTIEDVIKKNLKGIGVEKIKQGLSSKEVAEKIAEVLELNPDADIESMIREILSNILYEMTNGGVSEISESAFLKIKPVIDQIVSSVTTAFVSFPLVSPSGSQPVRMTPDAVITDGDYEERGVWTIPLGTRDDKLIKKQHYQVKCRVGFSKEVMTHIDKDGKKQYAITCKKDPFLQDNKDPFGDY